MELKIIMTSLLLFLATNAGAITLGFDCITENDPSGSSCYIAESQMSLDVDPRGDDQILFTFSNTGTIDSFIADVYFMYEGLDFLIFNSILNPDSGVSFSEGSRPSHLPGYNNTVAGFSAGSDSGGRYGSRGGRNRNGINEGESLGFLFDLEGATYDDVFVALLGGDLVIGVHAQGLGEFSESLITTPPAVVPLPATVWMFSSGLLLLFGLLRRSS